MSHTQSFVEEIDCIKASLKALRFFIALSSIIELKFNLHSRQFFCNSYLDNDVFSSHSFLFNDLTIGALKRKKENVSQFVVLQTTMQKFAVNVK